MADYDCEYCPKHIDNGGKCVRFEYNCPFYIIQQYDSEKIEMMRELAQKIAQNVERLEELDSKYAIESDISGLKFHIDNMLNDKLDEKLEKEWNRIQ